MHIISFKLCPIHIDLLIIHNDLLIYQIKTLCVWYRFDWTSIMIY